RSESDGNAVQVLEEVLGIQASVIGSSTGRDNHHIHITLLSLQGDLARRIDRAGQGTAKCCRLLLDLIQHVSAPHRARLLMHEPAPFLKKTFFTLMKHFSPEIVGSRHLPVEFRARHTQCQPGYYREHDENDKSDHTAKRC